jgi:hypothetical protein
MNSQVVLLGALGLVVYVVYRVVVALRKSKAAAARYQTMAAICAVHGGGPGPVDLPGVFNLGGLGFLFGLSNQFTNAADFSSREEKRRLFFTLVTARFPGLDLPLVAVTRKGLPGTPIWGTTGSRSSPLRSRKDSQSQPPTGGSDSCSSTCR